MNRRELIRFEKVKKSYGAQFVLEIENLRIHDGCHLGVYGSNGSGKSTLLRLIACVSKPDAGLIYMEPELVKHAPGFVPQGGGLYAHLTVRKNLMLRRRLHGLGAVATEPQKYVRELGLTPFLDRRVADLSGGYRRLTAVAAALVTEPKWLVLDEVFGSVDSRNRERLAALLGKLANELLLLVTASPEPDASIEPNCTLKLTNGKES